MSFDFVFIIVLLFLFLVFFFFFFLMIRRPPRSTRCCILFPTRRSSDLTRPVRMTNTESLESPSVMNTVFLGYVRTRPRSEEHTSELQSHSNISYAVFCLKKKKINEKGKRLETEFLKQQID